MAAFDKVRKRGLDDLPKLIRSAKDSVRTDLPLSRANDLFKLYKEVDLKKAQADRLRAEELRGPRRTATPTTWSMPGARRGSRRTSRRSGRTGRGRRRSPRGIGRAEPGTGCPGPTLAPPVY